MIEVFKTNVKKLSQAEMLVELLNRHFPGGRINFDLQDCDKILRVENKQVLPDRIIQLVSEQGYQCGVLE